MKTLKPRIAANHAQAGQVVHKQGLLKTLPKKAGAAATTSKARARPAELDRKITRLENRVSDLKTEKSELHQRAAQLRGDIGAQEKKITRTREAIHSTKAELKETEAELVDAGASLKRSKRSLLKQIRKQLNGIRKHATGCQEKIDEFEQDVLHRLDRLSPLAESECTEVSVSLVSNLSPQLSSSMAEETSSEASALSPLLASTESELPQAPKETKAKSIRTPAKIQSEAYASDEAAGFTNWLGEQFRILTSVEGVEAHHIEHAIQSTKSHAEDFSACESKFEHIHSKRSTFKSELFTLRGNLRSEVACCELLNNELKSVEQQIAEIQAEIDMLNCMIESMRQERARAAEADRIAQEQADAEAEYQHELERVRQEEICVEEMRTLDAQMRRLQSELQLQSKHAYYETAQDDAVRAQARASETSKLIDAVLTDAMTRASDASRIEAQIDRADVHFSSIISFLKSVVGSGSGDAAVSCPIPTGVRISGDLAAAMSEIAGIKSNIDVLENEHEEDVYAQSQREARKATLTALLDGLVPEPRHVKRLAVYSNAPTEWVAKLDEYSCRMDELNAQTPKHGQLKGVLEQRKMDEMRSFVGFIEGIGADSFLALLEGRAIEFDSSEMKDPTSKRRQHLDSVLDSLFCA